MCNITFNMYRVILSIVFQNKTPLINPISISKHTETIFSTKCPASSRLFSGILAQWFRFELHLVVKDNVLKVLQILFCCSKCMYA